MKLRINLFCYGTLMYPSILRAVTGLAPASVAARLDGYQCYRVRKRPFPGIVVESGGVVHGVLYPGLNPRMLQRLDEYESDFYQRREVIVRDATGKAFHAYVYVVPPPQRYHLTQQAWDRNWFVRRAMPRYLGQLRRRIRVT